MELKNYFHIFLKTYNPTTIISYYVNSKFSGDAYKSLGFRVIRYGTPEKHWYNMKTKDHVDDKMLKKIGYNKIFNTAYCKEATNEELMKASHYVEIYDAGKSTWIFKK